MPRIRAKGIKRYFVTNKGRSKKGNEIQANDS